MKKNDKKKKRKKEEEFFFVFFWFAPPFSVNFDMFGWRENLVAKKEEEEKEKRISLAQMDEHIPLPYTQQQPHTSEWVDGWMNEWGRGKFFRIENGNAGKCSSTHRDENEKVGVSAAAATANAVYVCVCEFVSCSHFLISRICTAHSDCLEEIRKKKICSRQKEIEKKKLI